MAEKPTGDIDGSDPLKGDQAPPNAENGKGNIPKGETDTAGASVAPGTWDVALWGTAVWGD